MVHALEIVVRRFEHFLFLGISGLFAIVPLFAWRQFIRLVRILVFDICRLRRKVVLSNLCIAFPNWSDAQRLKCGRKSFELFLLNMIEFLRSGFIEIWPGSSIENLELLEAKHSKALTEGKTTLGIVFHMSNWESVGPTLFRHGYKNSTISKSAGSPIADRFLTFIRERNGMGSLLITGAKGSVYRKILNAVKFGELVGFPMDQHRYDSPYIDFFEKPATTNASFVTIQQKQSLPVLVVYPLRTGLNRGKLVIERFTVPEKEEGETNEKFTYRYLEEINRKIAEVITKCPEQYFWLHNRWK